MDHSTSLEGEIHEDEPEALEKVRKEEMLGVDFFLDYCDGKLWISDFSNEILPFVGAYYEQYIHEYNVWVVNDLCDLPLEFVEHGKIIIDLNISLMKHMRIIKEKCGVNIMPEKRTFLCNART